MVWLPGQAFAAEYASAAEALEALDRMDEVVAARLEAIAAALPSARPFADSVLSDHARRRGERARLRRRLGLAEAQPATAAAAQPDLTALRTEQEALVYAHAEGLPALDDAYAVDVMARHMVGLARQLTVVDLWIEAEEQRASEAERRPRRD